MQEPENWAECGFPDDLILRSPYLPWVGLVKALNERREAVGLAPLPLPEYFTYPAGGMSWDLTFTGAISLTAGGYSDPSIIHTPRYRWNDNWDEFIERSLNGEDIENVTSYSRPEFSAKWAIWRYNQINLLRYKITWIDDWHFELEDINNTFKFKAPEP